MLDLYIYKVNNKDINNTLPLDILNHCKQYKNKSTYIQSIYAWSKLKDVLEQYYHINLDQHKVIFNKNGKPYFKDNIIYFNISHCDKLIAIAISDSEVGCDIEKDISLDKVELLANRLINKDKLSTLLSLSDKKQYLTQLWTQKECVLKLNGFDINILREEFELDKEFNTQSIEDSNQHYWCSVVNKNNEKVKKYGKETNKN